MRKSVRAYDTALEKLYALAETAKGYGDTALQAKIMLETLAGIAAQGESLINYQCVVCGQSRFTKPDENDECTYCGQIHWKAVRKL